MDLFNFISSIDIYLKNRLQNYNHSFTNTFINELKEQLSLFHSIKNIPENTRFTLDRYEENYVVCENRTTGEMINIPKYCICSDAKEGNILRIQNGKFFIDHEETVLERKTIKSLLEKNTKNY